MKKILVFLGVVLLVLIAIGIARLATGPAKENAHGIESKQPVPVVNVHGLYFWKNHQLYKKETP